MRSENDGEGARGRRPGAGVAGIDWGSVRSEYDEVGLLGRVGREGGLLGGTFTASGR